MAQRLAPGSVCRNPAILAIDVEKTAHRPRRGASYRPLPGRGWAARTGNRAARAPVASVDLRGEWRDDGLDHARLLGRSPALGDLGAGRRHAWHDVFRKHVVTHTVLETDRMAEPADRFSLPRRRELLVDRRE